MMRVLRGAASALLLLAVVVGGLAGLLAWGRISNLWRTDWATALTTPDDGTVLLTTLSVVGWLAWLAVTLTVIVEVLNAVTRPGRPLRLPGTSWLQPSVAVLVAAVIAVGVVSQRLAPVTTGAAPSAPPGSPPAAVATVAPTTATPRAAMATAHHVVVPGDDVWSLAERYYGDGARWRPIAEANPGVDIAKPLMPGTVLDLPGALVPAASARPNASAASPAPTVTVQPGDTLSGLASTWLGDGNRWPEIFALNDQQITDPDLIEVGWVLTIPAATPPVQASPPDQPSPPNTSTPPTAPPTTAPPTTAPPTTAPVSTAPHHSTDPTQSASPGPSPTATSTAPQVSSAATPPLPKPREDAPAPSTTPPGRPSETASVSAAPVVVAEAGDVDPARLVAGTVCGALALALLAGLAARRRIQLSQRPVGRRLPMPSPESARYEAALGRVAEAAPDAADGPDKPSPLTVLLGDRGERLVVIDLNDIGVLVVDGDPDLGRDLIGAAATSLVAAPWSEQTELLVVGLDWVAQLDDVRVTCVATPAEAARLVEREAEARRRARAESSSPEWNALTVLLAVPVDAMTQSRLAAVFEDDLDIAGIGTGGRPWFEGSLVLRVSDTESAHLDGDEPFRPQLIGEPARRALIDLHQTVDSQHSTEAPWWRTNDPPVHVLNPTTVGVREEDAVTPDHPTLRLLGPIELAGARGDLPPRAVKQCAEYCAWILQHPGSSSLMMAQALLVAEPTRRSNMSRLRSWLGQSPGGESYLPDAFTGRICLHPAVSSDWEHLQTLVAAGVNQVSRQALTDALSLVRGAPLADAAPGQWAWAEEWRLDMTSTIRDIGVVLARRSLEISDIETARWAAARALSAAPGDEILLGCRLRAEHLAGNRPEVERIVLQLTRQARSLGIDLLDETVVLLQEVMEGRPRERRA